MTPNHKINVACNGCDYYSQCRKKLVIGEEKITAKEQDEIPVKCQCVVQDVCRDCKWYSLNKCASWKTLNGKTVKHNLVICPKKEVL